MVEEVLEVEECGEVSEEQGVGAHSPEGLDCASDDSSPPAVEPADTDVGAAKVPPVTATPLLYS